MNTTTKATIVLSMLTLSSAIAEETTVTTEFKKLDKNDDNLLTADELGVRFTNTDSVQRIIEKNDTNGDGKLSIEETGITLIWPNHSAIFKFCDQNDDNSLSFEEFKIFGGKKTTREWYNMMDYDKIGKMNAGEFKKVIQDCQ